MINILISLGLLFSYQTVKAQCDYYYTLSKTNNYKTLVWKISSNNKINLVIDTIPSTECSILGSTLYTVSLESADFTGSLWISINSYKIQNDTILRESYHRVKLNAKKKIAYNYKVSLYGKELIINYVYNNIITKKNLSVNLNNESLIFLQEKLDAFIFEIDSID